MNNIKCELSNEDLIIKCRQWISSLCKTGGKSWTLQVPVNFEKDPDILFNEVCNRLAELEQEKNTNNKNT